MLDRGLLTVHTGWRGFERGLSLPGPVIEGLERLG